MHKDGSVTVLTGKVELGTGVSTSLRQIVADELDCPFEKISWVQGDTAEHRRPSCRPSAAKRSSAAAASCAWRRRKRKPRYYPWRRRA